MKIQSLNGAWDLRQTNKAEKLIPAVVPGCVHTDLIRAGVIPDPNWRDQELAVQWVDKVPWIYSRNFDITEETLNEDQVLLRAEGLDTLSEVWVNGQRIASTDNQHITWEWSVKHLLTPGINHLEIRFSPLQEFLEEKGKINPLPAWNEFYDWKHRGWIRKMHSCFGWDWSPVLVSCGIWRPILLIAFSEARLADVAISQTHQNGAVTVGVHLEIEPTRVKASTATVEIAFEGRVIASASISFTESATTGSASLPIPDPQLWWPNGMGEHPLYSVTVRLCNDSGVQLDEWSRRIGLRTFEVVRETDSWGESFFFRCNGVPFFVKGSNWAPPLPYSAWPEGDAWKTLLKDSAAVHMNMMRMWGGAYFAPNEFFDLCDELGLTVWQDFLFACGTYPAFDEQFLASIEKEARDNIRRLRHHASIALWCGNNELEPAFLATEWEGTKMSIADYDKVFHGILPRAVSELSPETPYWPASPWHPHRDRSISNIPWEPDAGDVHIWEIWFSDVPFETYRNYNKRFISEFGFQSFPHPKTIASYTKPNERQFNSPIMEHHQRSQPGNKQMLKFILDWFRFPENRDDLILLTQLVQAMAVKIGVEHWRRNMPRTMGALYWQINDCWPCPSWSSIDFEGRWKTLHYFVGDFFAPVLISGLENIEAGTVAVHVTNDQRNLLEGKAVCIATNIEGDVLSEESWPVNLPYGQSCEAGISNLNPILEKLGKNGVLVWLYFHNSEGEILSQNLVLFTRPKSIELQNPELQFQVQPLNKNEFTIEITAKKPALWVRLDSVNADTRFTENFRSLRPGEIWRIIATPNQLMSVGDFTKDLIIRDLYATYA